ncbi:MAG: hypothetical protein HWE13_10605 [Gammaproteobacteria bacterium]|nr:hypothetical protein [Gammaproteobacteria bacterium]NVK88571.1 hypothetical protein [Gammaproteobacteria bacterium]
MDRYYAVDGDSALWQSEFKPGTTSGKSTGYPDAQLLHYSTGDIKLTLELSYQEIGAVGPIVPIIPTPWASSEELMIKVDIQTPTQVVTLFNDWIITANKQSYRPSKVYSEDLAPSPTSGVSLNNRRTVYLQYEVKFSDADKISINFAPLQQGQQNYLIPPLTLVKVKGAWRYEVMTV